MEALALFKAVSAILVVIFLCYGMDVRRKAGTRHFVAPVWQSLMKIGSFALITAFTCVAFFMRQLEIIDWLSLAALAAGTAFVVAAKRALGPVHTFAGQYLEKPALVVHGVYAVTRNPLYLGVLLCEFGAALFMLHQAPLLLPQTHSYWLSAFAAALIYTVAFNWNMAVNEARYLQECFGDAYRRYRARVPFLIPCIRPGKEVE
jgi:protein-S-isoprenylcysteine O-methyltransferase Ste14